jgi:hypothetical protein
MHRRPTITPFANIRGYTLLAGGSDELGNQAMTSLIAGRLRIRTRFRIWIQIPSRPAIEGLPERVRRAADDEIAETLAAGRSHYPRSEGLQNQTTDPGGPDQ